METANSPSVDSLEKPTNYEPVLYRRRWLMLLLFSLASALNAFQWIHLNIVGDSIKFFWNATLPASADAQNSAVDWLSMIYMLAYIPFFFPANWVVQKFGLHIAITLGSGINIAGALLKCIAAEISQPMGIVSTSASCSFAVLMAGQVLCAIAQNFFLSIPAQLSMTWFGRRELAIATGIGAFANQVGVAFGFLLPPFILQSQSDIEILRSRFRILFYTFFAVGAVHFVVVLLFFRKRPPMPPSVAEYARIEALEHKEKSSEFAKEVSEDVAVQGDNGSQQSWGSALEEFTKKKKFAFNSLRIFKNVSFTLFTFSYGFNVGIYYAVATLLERLVKLHFEGVDSVVGWIGFIMVIAGLVGSLLSMVILKKWGKYKPLVILFYLMSVVSFAAYIGSIYAPTVYILFLTMFSLGFFQSGYLPLGFEYVAEITYPFPENFSSGILNVSAQIFGLIFTAFASMLVNDHGSLPSNLFMLAILCAGFIPTAFIKEDLRRLAAQKMVISVESDSTYDEL